MKDVTATVAAGDDFDARGRRPAGLIEYVEGEATLARAPIETGVRR